MALQCGKLQICGMFIRVDLWILASCLYAAMPPPVTMTDEWWPYSLQHLTCAFWIRRGVHLCSPPLLIFCSAAGSPLQFTGASHLFRAFTETDSSVEDLSQKYTSTATRRLELQYAETKLKLLMRVSFEAAGELTREWAEVIFMRIGAMSANSFRVRPHYIICFKLNSNGFSIQFYS